IHDVDLLDMDGDGLLDQVGVYGDPSFGDIWFVKLNQGSGQFGPMLFEPGHPYYYYECKYTELLDPTHPKVAHPVAVDLDGDGRGELVVPTSDTGCDATMAI